MTVERGGPARARFEDLTVAFGPTRAVDGLSVELRVGEIIGLLGHNGAGKSTLLNVASGAVTWSEGRFVVDGKEIPRDAGPRRLAERGITVIHQEPALAPNLSVLDNLFLARRVRGGRARRRARAREALAAVGSTARLEDRVGQLSLGERQLVDLARGSLGGPIRLLLLDEPTAALGAKETALLHEQIRAFAAAGTTVVYVSHRLPDILDVCERILVMRSGRLVLDEPARGLTLDVLSQALAPGVVRHRNEPAIAGAQAIAIDHHGTRLHAASGEVVGLFGMAAGEQFRILERLYGLAPDAGGGSADEGTSADDAMTLAGAPFRPRGPRDAVRHGVHYVPADREVDGLIPAASASENVLLPWYRALGGRFWAGPRTGRDRYLAARETFHVTGPDGGAPIGAFSGGNRQKHLLARWMSARRPDVLLLAQPTQGVDVGAKADITRALRALAAEGTAVLVASAEGDEIAATCDRAYVLRDGRCRALPSAPDLEERLLEALLALGGEEPAHRPAGEDDDE